MRTNLKIALAGTAGAVLLLGGAGTLSSWTDTQDLGTQAIASGNLALGVPQCQSWLLDGQPVDLQTSRIVPGDVLTRDCAIAVTATGDHLKADLSISTAEVTGGALAQELEVSAQFAVGGQPVTQVTSADDGSTVTATETVAFPFASATNGSKDLVATLQAVTVTATQVPGA